MSALRLAVFDVDGTLADSQAEIVAAMRASFVQENLGPPDRAAILGIVGLSLDRAMEQLLPEADPTAHDRLVAGYKAAYFEQRLSHGASPLYEGARDVLEAMAEDPELLIGVATGKSRRGLDALIEAHGLERFFVTRQVADFHPSKPHPAMLRAAMDEAGVDRAATVMIGDTSYDMEMARAAGTGALGVGWGYHPVRALEQAHMLVHDMAEIPQAVGEVLQRLALD